MNWMFPCGFPWPTVLYLVLYVGLWMLHVVFMGYVLAGTGFLTWATLFPGSQTMPRIRQPLAIMLRDWMPFVLSAAITAGIGPLLLVQVSYPIRFYTANLLLFTEWMGMLPALMLGFYLLYVFKSTRVSAWHWSVRGLVTLTMWGCFLFTGYSWTANHVLSLHEDAWPQVYAVGTLPVSQFWLLLRFFAWCGLAVSPLSVIAGWQMRYYGNQLDKNETEKQVQFQQDWQRLRCLAVGGLLLFVVCGSLYGIVSEANLRSITFSWLAGPYGLLALVGVGWQAWIWWKTKEQPLAVRSLVELSAGGLLMLLGAAVVREAWRLQHVDLDDLHQRLASLTSIGGWVVFLLFLIVNTLAIAWIIRTVAQLPPAADNKSK